MKQDKNANHINYTSKEANEFGDDTESSETFSDQCSHFEYR